MRYTIGELAEIIDGDRGKNYPQQHEFFDTGYCLFLNTGNVTSQGFLFEQNQYITQEKCEILRKGKLQRGDIVYTTRGTVGNAAYYNENVPYEHVRINSGMVIIRPNNSIVCTKFLYQILKSDYYRPYFKQYCTGSAQPQLPIKNFSKIELEIPPIETQKKIADILSAYDDLIENNQKQIKLLEEAAQRLYKEWFIDLHFPGYESTPITDGIPQGWKKEKLGEMFSTFLGGTPSRDKSEYWSNGTIPWINSGKVNELRIVEPSELITELAVQKSATKLLPKHTTLLAITGATLGQVSYTEIETCANQSVVGIVDKTEKFSEYIYCFVKNNINHIISKATGGAQQHINKEIVNEYYILIPCDVILSAFKLLVNPIFEKMMVLLTANIKLTEARDRLLPKLMNGEIEVTMDKQETVKVDKFENIRKHWQNVPYDEDLPLAARSTGDISEETLEKLKEIAEEE